MSLDKWDDHYSELTYNEPKRARGLDWLEGTLRRKWWWKNEWLLTGPWRTMGREKWFIKGGSPWLG